MSDFLSIKDAAAFLDVEYKTVYRLVTTGELPAARVGKLYRIERHDLEAYLQSTKKQAPAGTPVSPDDHLLCGNCGRVIPDPDLSGGQCGERACDELLCTACWGRGVRQCRTHQPTADQQMAQARQALAQGRVDRVVTAIEARQREQAFLARFEERVFGVAAIQHPLTGEVLQVRDWHEVRSYSDDSGRLLDLLGVAYLEHAMVAVTPINPGVRFELFEGSLGRSRPRQGLVLEARSVSDLAAYVSRKLVSEPSPLPVLMTHLNMRQLEAEQANALFVTALAATAGWDAESVRYIAASPEGRNYRHRLLLPILVDLHSGELTYNHTDERLKGFVGLFNLAREVEQVLRVRRLIESKIEAEYRRGGITLNEIVEEFREDPALVRQAFDQLTQDRRYRFVPDRDTGGMLLVNR
jgi:excisionase family DNA binding protein